MQAPYLYDPSTLEKGIQRSMTSRIVTPIRDFGRQICPRDLFQGAHMGTKRLYRIRDRYRYPFYMVSSRVQLSLLTVRSGSRDPIQRLKKHRKRHNIEVPYIISRPFPFPPLTSPRFL